MRHETIREGAAGDRGRLRHRPLAALRRSRLGYVLAELDKAVALPRSLTLDQLLQYGVDIDALSNALLSDGHARPDTGVAHAARGTTGRPAGMTVVQPAPGPFPDDP